jgi:hypothetical protein
MNGTKNHYGARRRAAVLAATAGIALLTAACGGGSPSSGSAHSPATRGPSNSVAQEDAYAHCLTSHGVTGVSVGSGGTMTINDGGMSMTLSGNGGIPSQVESQLSPATQSAINACKNLAPRGPRPSGGGQQPYNVAQGLKYTDCLRAHGVPNMPDPNGAGAFNLGGTGINPQSPQFEKAQQDCQSEQPAQISINSGTKAGS